MISFEFRQGIGMGAIGMSAAAAADDERAIRTLTARFADIVNRGAVRELAAMWTTNAVWALPVGDIVGVAAIMDTLTLLLDRHQRLVQLVASGEVVPCGDTAVCRWYVTEITLGKDGISRSFVGAYDDALRRTPDGWRFSRRMYQPLLRMSGQIEASAMPWDAVALPSTQAASDQARA